MEYSDLSGRSCYLDLPSNSCTSLKMKHVLQILGVKELTKHIIANITNTQLENKIYKFLLPGFFAEGRPDLMAEPSNK